MGDPAVAGAGTTDVRAFANSLQHGGSKTTVMFTNQLRQKIGIMFGNTETTSRRKCAEILRFHPS